MRNVLLNLIAVLLAFSVQGCWAGEAENTISQEGKSMESDPIDAKANNTVQKTVEVTKDNSSTYKKEISIPLKSGGKIILPSDCEKFDKVIKGCESLIYRYLGDRLNIGVYEIEVSAPESDASTNRFLIHGESNEVMGGFMSAKFSPDKKKVITSDGANIYWFPHRFKIYKINSEGFQLEFSYNFEKLGPGSKSKYWIGEVNWANETEIVFELYDNLEKETGESFRLIFNGNSWKISDEKLKNDQDS